MGSNQPIGPKEIKLVIFGRNAKVLQLFIVISFPVLPLPFIAKLYQREVGSPPVPITADAPKLDLTTWIFAPFKQL